jgi:acyl-CoA synthetase (NDP forming)
LVSRNHSLDEIFHPRSVAVVGVSSKEERSWDSWLTRLLHFGFSGPIYPINPNADTILGLKAYPSVRAVPGPVDYCIVQVPAEHSLDVLADCAAKGVRAVHFFTAGFTETASPEGKRLEEEMRRLQRQSGIRVLGPNCMGLYVPDAGLTIVPGMPKEKGNVAFITQSGFNAHLLVRMAAQRGARFSTVVSYGNAIDVADAELLEYLAQDAETDIVACYIEGVRNGPRFVHALEACLESKPVIMIKAGLTAAAARAVPAQPGRRFTARRAPSAPAASKRWRTSSSPSTSSPSPRGAALASWARAAA